VNTDGFTVYNTKGCRRVIVTRVLPGDRWLDILTAGGFRVDVHTDDGIPDKNLLQDSLGPHCDGVIGQLTENWDARMFSHLENAGCTVLSTYAVGYDNIDIEAATKRHIAVGNTPGVLTDTTAELACALTLAAARRIPEADRFIRNGSFSGWSPTLLLGNLLANKTVGVLGMGRIGSAYARIMTCGFRTNLLYYDIRKNIDIERYVAEYGRFLLRHHQPPVMCTRAVSVEELMEKADIVSIHVSLCADTYHMIGKKELSLMKEDAVLVNTSRGPILDEKALVEHCSSHPRFFAGLDVYENEPRIFRGLDSLENVVCLPHIGSATRWTRESMAVIAALNVKGIIRGLPAWPDPENVLGFLGPDPPPAVPSIINKVELGLKIYRR
jgi:hydroxypyruvate reductase 1